MCKESKGEIDYRFFPYLYESFKTLDHPKDVGTTEIVADDDDEKPVKCYLSFGRDEVEDEYEFCFIMSDDDILTLPTPVSALNIDAPINVAINNGKTDMQAPVSINCTTLTVASKDLLLTTPTAEMGNIVWDCDEFRAICTDGSVPNLKQRTPQENNRLLIITKTQTYFPFRTYSKDPSAFDSAEDQLNEAYGKLRRMILMFRSHSKGVLARYCEKIDNRIGKTPLGRTLIEGLIQEGVIYTDNIMYYINISKFGEVLGAKYDDIRSSVMNDKITSFLRTLIN